MFEDFAGRGDCVRVHTYAHTIRTQHETTHTNGHATPHLLTRLELLASSVAMVTVSISEETGGVGLKRQQLGRILRGILSVHFCGQACAVH